MTKASKPVHNSRLHTKDDLSETRLIMERLVKMPHKLHKDEPRKKERRPNVERRKSK